MCGIAGFVDPSGFDLGEGRAQLVRMTRQLVHRGPDGDGEWLDADAGVALGHRRLAIIDLTAEGHQPMVSATGRYVITFNGEVYNFRELRSILGSLGHSFRGGSDTEVMLAAIEQWGVVGAVRQFVGMFAFALWDIGEQRLFLCRDRLGKKPLYFGVMNGCLMFGSELKSLRAHLDFAASVNRDALALFMRHNYVPSPFCIYEDVAKLRPGHLAEFRRVGGGIVKHTDEAYWSAQEVLRHAVPYEGSFEAASRELEHVLLDAVRLRMIADVPLGAFLSGGIDSSLVVALMQAQSATPVRTFTIGFREREYNEADHALAVAKHLGTDHTEVYLEPSDALAVIPRLPTLYDEPFADASQIPTLLVSSIARRDVTVALSGDGGDELFCGYDRYLWWRQIWRRIGPLPAVARIAIGRLLKAVPVSGWNGAVRTLSHKLPREISRGVPGERIHKLADVLVAYSPEELYKRLVSHWPNPEEMVPGSREPATLLSQDSGIKSLDGFTEHMMLVDALTYLPDDVLVKVDRASMGVSLETRAPLLDHRVFEFAARLPLRFKLQQKTGKLLLRDILSRFVPPALYERPKAGFGVPIDKWLRGSLRDWAETLLNERRLRREGFFDAAKVRAVWTDYVARGTPVHYQLWDVLMFQSWLDECYVGVSRQ